MSADFTKPVSTDLHTVMWPQVRDNIDAVAKCFSGSTPATNIPTDAKRFDSGKWQTWNGTAWVDTLISVVGGGTGANSASGAREALDVYSKGDTDGKYLAKTNNLLDVANAATARANLGAHDASNLTTGTVSAARLPLGTTSAVGAVQLNDTTSSTSTTQAATANAVKSAYYAHNSGTTIYQSAVGADALWVKFIGAESNGILSVEFSDPDYLGGQTQRGFIHSALGTNSLVHARNTLHTRRIGSDNCEYRLFYQYSTYPTKKISVERFNMTTTAITMLNISVVHVSGTTATYVSTSNTGGAS